MINLNGISIIVLIFSQNARNDAVESNIKLLSRDKPAVQSQTIANAAASHAVDGKPDTAIDTGWMNDVWWYVDLLQECVIKNVTIQNREDRKYLDMKKVRIKCGKTLYDLNNCAYYLPGNTFYNVQCSCIGRLVSLKSEGKSILPITEIEVFGSVIVNGQWSNWTSCKETCANGATDCPQTRTCTNPKPENGGMGCIGESNRNKICPVHGMWSAWTSCNAACINGATDCIKRRTCTNPSPAYGSTECEGDTSVNLKCPIHGMWSAWTSCKATCVNGATDCIKRRTCTNPSPAYGGTKCKGDTSVNIKCPIDGQWSAWTSCESLCVDGVADCTKSRTCTNPKPQYEGNECKGDDTVIENCPSTPTATTTKVVGGVGFSGVFVSAANIFWKMFSAMRKKRKQTQEDEEMFQLAMATALHEQTNVVNPEQKELKNESADKNTNIQ